MYPGAAQRAVVRGRTGIVLHAAFAKVPDRQCSTALTLVLHSIWNTPYSGQL